MDMKNTKTAVIVMLILANLFFIYNIFNLKIKSENIPDETISDAVNILEKSGFIIDREKVPVKKPGNVTYEGVYSQDIFVEIVKNFSGISEDELKNSDMIVPGGISYVAGDYQFISSNLSNLSNSSNADYFKISIIETSYIERLKGFSSVNPDTGKTELEEETAEKIIMLSENGMSGVQKSDKKKSEKIIKDFMKKYQNQDVKLGFEITGFIKDTAKNCDCVLINQTVDGLSVSANTAYIEIYGGEVKYFSGEWYFGEFIAKYSMPLLDSVNILFKCMESDGSIIQESGKLTDMSLEYTVIHHDTEGFYLVPSWQITFDSGKKFSYNMITGGKN